MIMLVFSKRRRTVNGKAGDVECPAAAGSRPAQPSTCTPVYYTGSSSNKGNEEWCFSLDWKTRAEFAWGSSHALRSLRGCHHAKCTVSPFLLDCQIHSAILIPHYLPRFPRARSGRRTTH